MKITFAHSIKLKFLPATNNRGARYKASWEPRGWGEALETVTWQNDYGLRHADFVERAVEAFCDWFNNTVKTGVQYEVASVFVGAYDNTTDAILVSLNVKEDDE